jgi:uncharacterized RDD family membrane protein YckC
MDGDRARLTIWLLLLAAADRGDGVLSRVATRATGAVVGMVDVDAILDDIDVNALIARVDVDALLEQVEVDRLLARVDVNALLDRVDVDRLMARVDVRALAERAEIPDLVRESTGELAGSALDVFRRQIVGLDAIVGAAAYRLTGADPAQRPLSPPELVASSGTGRKGRGQVTGHFAGPLSRLAAFLVDAVVVWGVWVLFGAGIAFIAALFFGAERPETNTVGVVGLILLGVWAYLYFAFSLAIAGRTPGMGLVGIRVVERSGSPLSGRGAFIRTLVFPFSFLIFGLGFLGIFTSPERRTMHDAAAGSVVVYDWGDRPAEMPAPLTNWMMRRAADDPSIPAEELPVNDAPRRAGG